MASVAPSIVTEDQELAFAAITVLQQILKQPLAYEQVLMIFERLKLQGQNHVCLSGRIVRGRCELDLALQILCSRRKIVHQSNGRYKIRSPFDGVQYPFLDFQVREYFKL